MYTCEICGKKYDNLRDRANCELKCFADREAAEEKKRQLEMARNKAASEEDVVAWLMDAEKVLHDHMTEYGSITINEDFPYLRYVFGNARFWF